MVDSFIEGLFLDRFRHEDVLDALTNCGCCGAGKGHEKDAPAVEGVVSEHALFALSTFCAFALAFSECSKG